MKKIRKVYSGVVPNGKVLNSRNDSLQDTYSSDYLNRHIPDVNDLGEITVDDIACKNLLYTPYNENNKLTITATKDDYYTETGYRCYLEAGKTYVMSFESDGEAGPTAGTDTVQLWLLYNKEYTYKHAFSAKELTFVPEVTGYYYLRFDVNKNGTTHSFWNIQVELGNVATDYVEHKEYNNENLKTTTQNYTDYITFNSDVTVDGCYVEKMNNILYLHALITRSIIKGTNTFANVTKTLKCGAFGAARVYDGSFQYPATATVTSDGNVRLYSTVAGTNCGFTLIMVLNEENETSSVATTSLEEIE